MTHTTDARIAGVRIDAQAADADKAVGLKGGEQRLAGTVEAVDTRLPLLGQPAQEAVPLALDLDRQVSQAGRQVGQTNELHSAWAGTSERTASGPRRRQK